MKIEQVLGVDRGKAFSDAELTVLKGLGIEVLGIYIGGPYYGENGWTKSDVQLALDKEFGVVPIYVGQNFVKGSVKPTLTAEMGRSDAHQAELLMRDFDLDRTEPETVVLDVEFSTWYYDYAGTLEYVISWIETVRDNGFKPCVYGGLAIIDALIRAEKEPDYVWLASWISDKLKPKLSLDNMPGLPNSVFVNNQRAWQYSGGVILPALNGAVDLDLFDKNMAIYKTSDVRPVNGIDKTVTLKPVSEEVTENKTIAVAIELLDHAVTILKGM